MLNLFEVFMQVYYILVQKILQTSQSGQDSNEYSQYFIASYILFEIFKHTIRNTILGTSHTKK